MEKQQKWRDTAKSIPEMEREQQKKQRPQIENKNTNPHPDANFIQQTHFGYTGAYA